MSLCLSIKQFHVCLYIFYHNNNRIKGWMQIKVLFISNLHKSIRTLKSIIFTTEIFVYFCYHSLFYFSILILLFLCFDIFLQIGKERMALSQFPHPCKQLRTIVSELRRALPEKTKLTGNQGLRFILTQYRKNATTQEQVGCY